MKWPSFTHACRMSKRCASASAAHRRGGKEVALAQLQLQQRRRLRAVGQRALHEARAREEVAALEVDVHVQRARHAHGHTVHGGVDERPHVKDARLRRGRHLQAW